MTKEISRLQRLRARSEGSGATIAGSGFNTDMTSSGTSFTSFVDLPFDEGTLSMQLNQEMLPVSTAQQFMDGLAEDILGRKTWSLSFTMPLHATGVAANASTSSVQGPLGLLLACVMGGESLSAGTAVDSGASTTGCVVTAGQGSRVPIGTAIFNGSDAIEIKSRSTDTITLKRAAAATLSSTLYRSATYYLTENPAESMQFVIEGVEADDRWVLMGGQGSFSMSFPIAGIPTITFNFAGVNWINYSGSAIAAASVSNFTPIAFMSSDLQVTTVGSTTANSVVINGGINISCSLSYTDIRSAVGQTVFGKRRTRTAPVVSGDFTTFYEDQTWFTERSSSTDRAIFLQVGSTAGSTLLISIPTAQIIDVQPTDADSVRSQRVAFKGRLDTELGTASEISRSALRIHRL